jgi:signal transduction histidine kinase
MVGGGLRLLLLIADWTPVAILVGRQGKEGIMPIASPQGQAEDARDGDSRVPLDAVISTAELSQRGSRPANYEAENRALASLLQEMTNASGNILQKLVETALSLCGAHSAGTSILEEENGRQVFRWHATAGQWSGFQGGTMPREISPCGTVLDRNNALLMSYPERHYPFPPEIAPPVVEVLLIPFHVAGEAVGTIWVIAHDESRKFDREDQRLMTRLGRFAAAAYQLLVAKKALKEADRRKDEFLATLSHELRNPLAPIRHAVEILRLQGGPGPETQWVVDVIDRQLRQMTRLLDDLLDVARITTNRLELRKARIDLAEVLQVAVETSRPLIEECGQDFALTMPPHSIALDGDRTRLAQVIANLLNNAAKYTDRGGHIWLTAEQRGHEAVVTVRDTGIGISTEMLPCIFEMFTQADRSLERAHSGLGIGLALAQQIVELHGGTITAHSDGPGTGCAFALHLPVILEAEPALRGARPARERPASAVSRRILVVDDERISATSLGRLLKIMGHEIRTAYDGLEAVGVVEAFRPDVVLLDINLPKMNGYDAARRIRQQPWGQGMVLIALTGWGQEADRQRAREAGFDHHLVKPVDSAILTQLLASL